MSETVCCVEVRFLNEIICRRTAADHGQAERYVAKMRELYWGAQVTINEGECPGAADPLPDNSALWGLTVK